MLHSKGTSDGQTSQCNNSTCGMFISVRIAEFMFFRFRLWVDMNSFTLKCFLFWFNDLGKRGEVLERPGEEFKQI